MPKDKNVEVFTGNAGLTTLNKKQIAKINKRLPEFHRAKAIIGHSTSQTSYSLQTMNMISDSPMARMKQCLAQIRKKYSALKEAYFKIEQKKIDILELSKKTDKTSRLKVQEYQSNIEDTSISMENALRQIGMFQDMYDSIMKENNIPENWNEKDYENQEISHMVKSSFRIGLQDLMSSGRVGKAAVEYWEQLGIHPTVAGHLTANYLEEMNKRIVDANPPTILDMYKFLDDMAERFKDSYKKALKRIGLNEIGSEEFMAEGFTKPK